MYSCKTNQAPQSKHGVAVLTCTMLILLYIYLYFRRIFLYKNTVTFIKKKINLISQCEA